MLMAMVVKWMRKLCGDYGELHVMMIKAMAFKLL